MNGNDVIILDHGTFSMLPVCKQQYSLTRQILADRSPRLPIDVKKNVFYVFYSRHVFYDFNVFLFCQRFLFLKTFFENTI